MDVSAPSVNFTCKKDVNQNNLHVKRMSIYKWLTDVKCKAETMSNRCKGLVKLTTKQGLAPTH